MPLDKNIITVPSYLRQLAIGMVLEDPDSLSSVRSATQKAGLGVDSSDSYQQSALDQIAAFGLLGSEPQMVLEDSNFDTNLLSILARRLEQRQMNTVQNNLLKEALNQSQDGSDSEDGLHGLQNGNRNSAAAQSTTHRPVSSVSDVMDSSMDVRSTVKLHTDTDVLPRHDADDGGSLTCDILYYPLPTSWDTHDFPSVNVSKGGTELKLNPDAMSTGKNMHIGIKANKCIPANCGVFYFEIEILSGERECKVSVGLAATDAKITTAPGLDQNTWGYHGLDGEICCNHEPSVPWGPKFRAGDIIGCGINYRTQSVFFTRNGIMLGTAFSGVNEDVFPCVGLSPGCNIKSNFGINDQPFLFDIYQYIENEKGLCYEKINGKINSDAKSSQTLPSLNGFEDGSFLLDKIDGETPMSSVINENNMPAVLQQLMASYFTHLGYVDTAKSFKEEIEREHELFTASMTEVSNTRSTSGIKFEENDSVVCRQMIRQAIISGNIDKAFGLLKEKYPDIGSRGDILFKLKCRKFVELIGAASRKEISISEAMSFGQQLNQEYTDEDVSSKLAEIFSLVAYEDPQSSKYGYLLSDSERARCAEEVNAAILVSRGKCAQAGLDILIAQTEGVVRSLFERNEGDALFVNVKKDMLSM